jgi:hypothetical protein
MIRFSPFMAAAPVLAAQSTYAVQEWYDLCFTGAEAAMVLFGYPNDRFHHIWEAAATATALLERMIDLRRHDELPGVGIEKPDDDLLDFLLGNQVAMADQHLPTHGLTAD